MLNTKKIYRLWEILYLIDTKQLPKDTKFIAMNLPINMTIKYDGNHLVYHKLMSNIDEGQYITLCAEINCDYIVVK